MIEIRIAETEAEREAVYRFRYGIYVEELGLFQRVADHEGRRLADPEDEWSWIAYAVEDGEVVASTRLTWGGDGFSSRQISQYGLVPFLAELPPDVMAVGERTMIAPSHRGTDLLTELGTVLMPLAASHDVRMVIGACEPHLISYYCRYQRPFGTRNITGPDSDYLIPLVSFCAGPEALDGLGDGPGTPRCIQAILDGSGTVRNALLGDPDEYADEVRRAMRPLSSPAFAGLSEDEVARCVARSSIIRCAEGDRVLKQGGRARNLFVVLSGAMEVNDGEHVLAVLLPGDVFGEAAYLLHQPRSCNVDVLADDTRVLSLSERTLQHLCADDPVLGAKLTENLSRVLCGRLVDVKAS